MFPNIKRFAFANEAVTRHSDAREYLLTAPSRQTHNNNAKQIINLCFIVVWRLTNSKFDSNETILAIQTANLQFSIVWRNDMYLLLIFKNENLRKTFSNAWQRFNEFELNQSNWTFHLRWNTKTKVILIDICPHWIDFVVSSRIQRRNYGSAVTEYFNRFHVWIRIVCNMAAVNRTISA